MGTLQMPQDLYHRHKSGASRPGQNTFFKHKYFTQPPITEFDALLRVTEDMFSALKGSVTPIKGEMRTAGNTIMDIFKRGCQNSQLNRRLLL